MPARTQRPAMSFWNQHRTSKALNQAAFNNIDGLKRTLDLVLEHHGKAVQIAV